jgi:hypothetical protein
MKLLSTLGWCLGLAVLLGCGTTKSQRATQQLLMSDAVDRAVASIDFRPLSHQRVYLDTTYLQNMKNEDLVNADYIISSLRQQMVGAGCLLVDSAEEAQYVAEARVGALGTDGHDMVYGIPANNALSTAATLVPNTPAIPIVPEIALARKSDEIAAAKIAVFAYHRETRRPVWQSGLARARSEAKDTWFFGAGPFRSGTIHDGTAFVDGDLPLPLFSADDDEMTGRLHPLTHYSDQATFAMPTSAVGSGAKAPVQPAAHAEAVPATPDASQEGTPPAAEGENHSTAEGQASAAAKEPSSQG